MDACPDFIGVVNPAIAGSIFQRSLNIKKATSLSIIKILPQLVFKIQHRFSLIPGTLANILITKIYLNKPMETCVFKNQHKHGGASAALEERFT
jgi:hypothetical protein